MARAQAPGTSTGLSDGANSGRLIILGIHLPIFPVDVTSGRESLDLGFPFFPERIDVGDFGDHPNRLSFGPDLLQIGGGNIDVIPDDDLSGWADADRMLVIARSKTGGDAASGYVSIQTSTRSLTE